MLMKAFAVPLSALLHQIQVMEDKLEGGLRDGEKDTMHTICILGGT
jgi:hypothetical protein